MRIYKRISEWIRLEKMHYVCLCGHLNIWKTEHMRLCCLYKIRIHYADWDNICACAYSSAYLHETA